MDRYRSSVFFLIVLLIGLQFSCKEEEVCEPTPLDSSLGFWPIELNNEWYYYAQNDCREIEKEGMTISRVIPPLSDENKTDSLLMFILSPINCLTCPENTRYGININNNRVYRLNLAISNELNADLLFDFNLSQGQSTESGYTLTNISSDNSLYTFVKGNLEVKMKRGFGPAKSFFKDKNITEAILEGAMFELECNTLQKELDNCRRCTHCEGYECCQ